VACRAQLADRSDLLLAHAQLGSILSNCLLVLGCAFLLGGIKYTVQRFNRPAAVTNCAMLMLSVMTLMCTSITRHMSPPILSTSGCAVTAHAHAAW
jgi:calcium/proton exchanger cax